MLDVVTGDEISLFLFYLAPVAMAAWYGGRATGLVSGLLACASWTLADAASGITVSHPAIAAWNLAVRLGYFALSSLLITALQVSWRSQERLALTDALTGLHNRRALEERLRHDLASARRRGAPLTLAFVDLDDFKQVNDTRGHAEGDRLLREMAATLRGALRESDTAARIGGDEFALLLPDTDARGAVDAAHRLGAQLPPGTPCSIGMVTFTDTASLDAGHALTAADRLMYRVKRQGKGAVAFAVEGGPTAGAAPEGRHG